MSSIKDQLASYGRSTGPRSHGFRLSSTIDTSRFSKLGCGAKCCKFSLMGLSIFLILVGIGTLAGGAYAMNNLEVVDAIGPDFTNCIIAFGVLLIIIGSLGLAGSMNESRAVLACFLVLMSLMCLVLLIFGAWALSNQNKEGNILARAWQQMTSDQKHRIEKAYGCCGAHYWGSATNPAMCPCNQNECGGCIPRMITDFRNLYTAFGAIYIIVAAFMLLTLVVAYCLMSGIAKSQEKPGKGQKGKGRR